MFDVILVRHTFSAGQHIYGRCSCQIFIEKIRISRYSNSIFNPVGSDTKMLFFNFALLCIIPLKLVYQPLTELNLSYLYIVTVCLRRHQLYGWNCLAFSGPPANLIKATLKYAKNPSFHIIHSLLSIRQMIIVCRDTVFSSLFIW
jgi:hypothetical protein